MRKVKANCIITYLVYDFGRGLEDEHQNKNGSQGFAYTR